MVGWPCSAANLARFSSTCESMVVGVQLESLGQSVRKVLASSRSSSSSYAAWQHVGQASELASL
eukprot:COSAG01_NODE_3017_length_6713_cov_20.316752_4_plen_64_part_00